MKLKRIALFLFVLGMLGIAPEALAIVARNPDTLHEAGTNVIDESGTVYRIMDATERRPYTSAGAFLSYGFNSWSNVVVASPDDMNLQIGSFIPPQDGKIICSDRGTDKGTCYLISDGDKLGFTSATVFASQGFSFGRALYGDTSFLPRGGNIGMYANQVESHHSGTLINLKGTIYLVTSNGIKGFPDMSTFESWGYTLDQVVPANVPDQSFSIVGLVQLRKNFELNPNPHAAVYIPPVVEPGKTILTGLHSLSPVSSVSAGIGKDLIRFYLAPSVSGGIIVQDLGFEFGGNVSLSALSNIKIIDNRTNTEVGSAAGLPVSSNLLLVNIPKGINLGDVAGLTSDFTVQADISPSALGSTVSVSMTQIWTGAPAQSLPVGDLPVLGNTLNISNRGGLMY
jgi:hypothetical protein